MPAITLQHLLNRSSYAFENLFEGIKSGFLLDYIQIGIQFFNIPVFIVDHPGDRIIVCHVSLLQDRGSRSPRLKSGEESTLSISPYTFTPHAHSSCRMRFDRDSGSRHQRHETGTSPVDHGYTQGQTVLYGKHGVVLPGPPSTGLWRSAPLTPGERWNREAYKERGATHGIMPLTRGGGS